MSDFDLFIELRSEFKERLARKTGWGRSEVLEEFDGAAVRVVRMRRTLPPAPTPFPDPQYPLDYGDGPSYDLGDPGR